MDDWEDEKIPPLVLKEQPKSKWDDEDVDENDVKESWEDEDESAPEPVAKPPPEKVSKKPVTKPAEKKGKTVVAKEESEPLDPVAEKLRQQRFRSYYQEPPVAKVHGHGDEDNIFKIRINVPKNGHGDEDSIVKIRNVILKLVEEADYRSTTELFGKRGDENTLDNFIPKSESDFLEYAELVSHKLRPYEKSFHYIGLLKAVMRLSMTAMKAADAKDVASSVTAIANEKLKAEKEAMAGKKKGGKKKQLHVDKPDDDLVADTYDALDDYDFM